VGDKLFIVRRMTEADLRLALGWAAAEGRNPSLHDAHCFCASVIEGSFSANENTIATVPCEEHTRTQHEQ
jgi:hypothetical protein